MAMLPCGNWQFKKTQNSAQIDACFEFTTDCSSHSKITFVASLHISETMPFVCARNVSSHSHPNGASQQLVIGLLLLHCFLEQVFLNASNDQSTGLFMLSE